MHEVGLNAHVYGSCARVVELFLILRFRHRGDLPAGNAASQEAPRRATPSLGLREGALCRPQHNYIIMRTNKIAAYCTLAAFSRGPSRRGGEEREDGGARARRRGGVGVRERGRGGAVVGHAALVRARGEQRANDLDATEEASLDQRR